ncbi:MAG TPA: hypothetical protein VGI03_07945 [Verrucomicrobiae bacterium]|jgi:hypothetical protein
MKKLPLWAKIVVGVIVSFTLLILIGSLLPDQSTTSQSNQNTNSSDQTSQSGTNSVFESGAWIGAVDGIAAYNRGDSYPTDEEFDSKGRRDTADMKFDNAGDRQDWMNGYKAGFKIGWDKEKDGK